jgi:hypothetical protein
MIALTLVAIAVAVPLIRSIVEKIGTPPPGNGSVVLVEHMKQTRGRLVNGTYEAVQLGGPDYSYDSGHRQLGGSGLEINDSLRVTLGVTESLSQDAGSGVTGDAYGIYELPARARRRGSGRPRAGRHSDAGL